MLYTLSILSYLPGGSSLPVTLCPYFGDLLYWQIRRRHNMVIREKGLGEKRDLLDFNSSTREDSWRERRENKEKHAGVKSTIEKTVEGQPGRMKEVMMWKTS